MTAIQLKSLQSQPRKVCSREPVIRIILASWKHVLSTGLEQTISNSSHTLKKLDTNSLDLVTRIILVSHPTDKSAFSMIFQMSHVIADGHTYYKILNSIASTEKIAPKLVTADACAGSMTIIRKEETTPVMKEAQGMDDYNYMMSGSFASAAVKGLAFGRRAKVVCRFVDDERMIAAKAKAMSAGVDGVKFVSSNDVLSSTMANMTGVRLFGEAISFRGKIPGLDDSDAGNYESLLWLDKEVYTEPAKVRKMMQDGAPYKGRGLPLPGFSESFNSQFGVMTNWAGFAATLVIGGCEAELHLPLVPVGMVPCENACVFRPCKNKLAVMYFTKRFEDENFLEACPLGDVVSKEIFG